MTSQSTPPVLRLRADIEPDELAFACRDALTEEQCERIQNASSPTIYAIAVGLLTQHTDDVWTYLAERHMLE